MNKWVSSGKNPRVPKGGSEEGRGTHGFFREAQVSRAEKARMEGMRGNQKPEGLLGKLLKGLFG